MRFSEGGFVLAWLGVCFACLFAADAPPSGLTKKMQGEWVVEKQEFGAFLNDTKEKFPKFERMKFEGTNCEIT
jgi:hypothetical protein